MLNLWKDLHFCRAHFPSHGLLVFWHFPLHDHSSDLGHLWNEGLHKSRNYFWWSWPKTLLHIWSFGHNPLEGRTRSKGNIEPSPNFHGHRNLIVVAPCVHDGTSGRSMDWEKKKCIMVDLFWNWPMIISTSRIQKLKIRKLGGFEEMRFLAQNTPTSDFRGPKIPPRGRPHSLK